MIKTKNGNVKINGDSAEILADLTVLVKSVRDALREHLGEEADKLVDICIENSKKSEEEIAKEILSMLLKKFGE